MKIKSLMRAGASVTAKLLCCIMLLDSTGSAQTTPPDDLQKQINDLERKIKASRTKLAGVIKQIEEDDQAFTAYRIQNESYHAGQRDELEALKNDYSLLRLKTDSLSSLIQAVKTGQREQDLFQERFAQAIAEAGTQLKQAILSLPPGNTHNQLSSLEFLQSELSVKAVDNAEAIERFWQILAALAENSQSIDVFSGQSPVPFIAGPVDYIRLGYAYLAVVNEHGTAGALWIPSADGSGGAWEENNEPKHLLALKKCVAVRQGNAVPEITGIPFRHPVRDDAIDSKGGDR